MQTAADKPLDPSLLEADAAISTPLCPVDRLPRRRRNKICIWIIALGGANFMAYTLLYAGLGGDALNGYRALIERADGTQQAGYFIRGHHVDTLAGRETSVSRGVWIYSFLHSITVPITSGAMIISMLVLARPHIIATMRDGLISGRTFVTAFGTIVVLVTVATVILFTCNFVMQLSAG